MFELIFADVAAKQLQDLESSKDKKAIYKAVCKALAFLEANPHHPSLNSHKYIGMTAPNGDDVYTIYAQNNTPGAYRIFWYFGSKRKTIYITKICKHL